MSPTHDDDGSPCAADARHRDGWRRVARFAAISVVMSLGVVPRALSAQEYYNLDAGRRRGMAPHVGSYSAKLLLTKTFAHWRVNLNGGLGTWSIRPASSRASTSCTPIPPDSLPPVGCSAPPPIPPVVGCARAPSNQARFACLAGAPTSLGEAARTRSMADTSSFPLLSGPRYTAAFGVDHAFPLSSTLFIADVVMERYVDLYDIADVIGEVGLRHQLTPQVVADVGVSRSFAGRVRSSSVTLGLSFALPMQLRSREP